MSHHGLCRSAHLRRIASGPCSSSTWPCTEDTLHSASRARVLEDRPGTARSPAKDRCKLSLRRHSKLCESFHLEDVQLAPVDGAALIVGVADVRILRPITIASVNGASVFVEDGDRQIAAIDIEAQRAGGTIIVAAPV